jgi:hypothetical protein
MSDDIPRAYIDPGDESVVHIAGPLIDLAGRRAQRCVWCGADLLEPPPWRPSKLPPLAFPDGALVRLAKRPDGGVRGVLGPFDAADPPLDLCAYSAPDSVEDFGPLPGRPGPPADD